MAYNGSGGKRLCTGTDLDVERSNGNNYMAGEPRRKREPPARPNHILLYTIINPAYPITVDPALESSVESEANTSANQTVVQIHFTQKKFQEITSLKEYNDRKSTSRKRQYSVFLEGKWQEAVTEQLWEECRIACGFQYSRGRVNEDNTAAITGKCKCGTSIQCAIADTRRDIVIATCTLSGFSNEKCSKRPLRKLIGDELALRMVQTEEVPSKLFKEKAAEVMVFGDKLPPHLYAPKVLADAKYKYLRGTRSHEDPLTSLLVLKSGIYQNAIHDIGVDPFYVYYVTSQQLHVYCDYAASSEAPKIVIDATGSIVKKIMKPDGNMSNTILLYAIVIHNQSQIMVNQMLSEAHDALHIGNWLRHYLSIGAPPPKEVVSDDGRAIIIAEIHAFTQYSTITEYSNACYNGQKPACYIRIDNAHFIKKMANLLKECQPAVRKLMLASIGQLILARSLEAAGEILANIFVVCISSSGGTTSCGQKTACAKAIDWLKTLVTMREPDLNNMNVDEENEEVETLDSTDLSDEQYFGPGKNLYHEWAKAIYVDAQRISDTDIGCDPNPYQMKQLAIALLRDCKQLPLWSNVVRDVFGYGRVPATSAIVESAFNDLKTRTLNKKVGFRADDFLQKHLHEISGATVVAAARARTQDICTLPKTPPRTACPLCAEGTAPTAHFCAICSRPVHLIFGCSEALSTDDEGFGQQRVCGHCASRKPSSIEAVLESREVENWGGHAKNKENEPPKKNKKSSFYMGSPIKLKDLKIRRGRTDWPILKNSSCMSLKPILLNNKKVTLNFTCAFDAFSQLLLRSMEEDVLKNHITSWDSDYSDFLTELHHKGIVSNTYKKRAELLIKYLPENKIDKSGSVYRVACDIVAAELVCMLLPAFAECNTACETCGYNTTLTLRTVSIADSDLYRLEDAVGAVFRVKESECQPPCPRKRTTETAINSPLLVIDVYETRMNLERIKVDDIPRSISPLGRDYSLMGVVVYEIAPGSRTRTVKELANTVQHYTALLFCDGFWTVIDDMKSKTMRVKKNLAIVPAILLYARLEKH